MTQTSKTVTSFHELELPSALLSALDAMGYETPTEIQAATIPPLLAGGDVLGHAPTGTGKTAAFALPVLASLKPGKQGVQALVLAPTRELGIQVAEAFATYAANLNVRVLPVYGGQEYSGQIRKLKQGVDIVVGTPGRIMDHMRRGTLDLSNLQTLVLDEADEMLRMGFIDDVKWILEQSPSSRRIAMFSATMPREVKRIASTHLKNPTEISISKRGNTTESIRQRYWSVTGFHKLNTLTRILEAEPFDGMIIFVRTKNATTEVAERLSELGYKVSAMNGDMAQKQREQTVNQLKNKRLDILVATDVVARGLDVDRVSHVVNYDVPFDAEAYVHRIGRTGRAGRTGDAILFLTPREQRMLHVLERATGGKITKLEMPSVKMINERRTAEFKQRILSTIDAGKLDHLQKLVEELVAEKDLPASVIAAALAKLSLGDNELLLDESRDSIRHKAGARDRDRKPQSASRADGRREGRERREGQHRAKDANGTDKRRERGNHRVELDATERKARRNFIKDNGIEVERFRVDVGSSHGMQASNLVGAIANEAGLDSQYIGRISISEESSTVELPTGMPKAVLKDLRGTWVCNRKLNMARDTDSVVKSERPSDSAAKPKSYSKPKKNSSSENPHAGKDSAPKKPKRDKQRHKKKKQIGKRRVAEGSAGNGAAGSKPPKKHKKNRKSEAA